MADVHIERSRIVHAGMLIDPSRRFVEIETCVLKLTEREFQLLHTLAKRPGVVFPPDTLQSALWGANASHSGRVSTVEASN
jgi:DNA-binding response OmpR family regulator